MKKIILISLICLSSVQILKSQVTIGSSNEPVKAALLDLKTKNPEADNVTVENGKGGGLVLPRVQLVSKTTLEPFIPTTDSDWLTKEAEMKKLHIGMMVYNLKSNSVFSPGIYVWAGTEWVKEEINATNGLTKTGSNIQLGGTLNETTQIDQETYSLTFTGGASASGNDKIYMKNVKNNIPTKTDSIATMGIDGDSGELFVMKANNKPGTTMKAISYVVYKLTGKGARVRDFNTQIKVADYTLMVVGSRFATQDTYGGVMPDAVLKNKGAMPIGSVYADNILEKTATEQDNWIIHANYANAHPSDNKHGTWTIYCLVFNNSLINVHEDNPMPYSNGGNNTIDAVYPPVGL
jgi:hypothetical protein